jgi:hypothetical protein
MAGCSGTPLGTQARHPRGASVALVEARPGWSIPDLPDSVEVHEGMAGGHDVVLAFDHRERALPRHRLTRFLPDLKQRPVGIQEGSAS